MRIMDWSSDVCSTVLDSLGGRLGGGDGVAGDARGVGGRAGDLLDGGTHLLGAGGDRVDVGRDLLGSSGGGGRLRRRLLGGGAELLGHSRELVGRGGERAGVATDRTHDLRRAPEPRTAERRGGTEGDST